MRDRPVAALRCCQHQRPSGRVAASRIAGVLRPVVCVEKEDGRGGAKLGLCVCADQGMSRRNGGTFGVDVRRFSDCGVVYGHKCCRTLRRVQSPWNIAIWHGKPWRGQQGALDNGIAARFSCGCRRDRIGRGGGWIGCLRKRGNAHHRAERPRTQPTGGHPPTLTSSIAHTRQHTPIEGRAPSPLNGPLLPSRAGVHHEHACECHRFVPCRTC